MKGTGNKGNLAGTENMENQDIDFGEKGKIPICFRGNTEFELY